MASKRNHPWACLVLWLGVALFFAILALVIVVFQLPASDVLDRTFTDGMHQGNVMCLDLERQFNPAAEAPAAPVPTTVVKSGLI